MRKTLDLVKKSQNKNEHINTQKPPSRTSGEYRKRSEVETGNTQGILKYSFNEPINDPIGSRST